MVQILPAVQKNRKPSFGEQFSQGLGKALELSSHIYSQHQKNEALKNAGFDPNLPEDFQKLAYEAKIKSQEKGEKLSGNKNILSDVEDKYDLPKGSLDAYVENPAMGLKIVQERAKTPKKTQASQPIDPEQLQIIKDIRSSEEYQKAPPLKKYQLLTDAGVSKENSQAEADIAAKGDTLSHQRFETSYKAQENFINETTNSYKAFETEMKPRILQMQNISDEDLISPTAAVFLEALHIPLGALEDPSSELYDKLSQDLLKGLPETYGSRILKVEVDNFLKTIPRLLNSPEGRRMIASNMLKLGEMKEVYYNEMRKTQKELLHNNSEFPRDFQQEVFDQVKPQIDKINKEFVKLSEIKHVPPGKTAFFDPNGNIVFVGKDDVEWAMKNGGKRIW